MRQIFYCLLSWIFLLGCSYNDLASDSTIDSADQSYGDIVSELVHERKISGVVLVKRGSETLHRQAYNVEPLQADFEILSNTAFAIASLTKSFTAVLMLDRISEGMIELDKPISAYIPNFDAVYADSVTVRQLLQNRSGIPHYVDVPGWFDPKVKRGFTTESFLAAMSSLELKFTPGSDYYYSNVNYYLLGLILESATGQSYESLLHERILEPLELNSTGQIYSRSEIPIAPSYLREEDSYKQMQIGSPELFRATASQMVNMHSMPLQVMLRIPGWIQQALL